MDRRKSGARCVLPHCGKTMRNTIGIKMFKFPPEGTLLGSIWRQVCGLPMDKGKIYLCETHFSKDLIGLRHRKRDAIPSLFLTSNNNEGPKPSVVPSVLVKLGSIDKRELNSAESVKPFCSNCEESRKCMHFYVEKCTLLQKQKTILQARIKSYCRFKKRAQMQIFMLKNLYYKFAEKFLRPSQDAIPMDTLNIKIENQNLGEQAIELIQKQNEMEWKLLTQMTDESLKNDKKYKEEKQDWILKSEKAGEGRLLWQAGALPIENNEGTRIQNYNEPLNSDISDKSEARRVKRNEIINRYRLRRKYFSVPNKKKQNRMKDEAKRRLQLLCHILPSRKRSILKYSDCEKNQDETKVKVSRPGFDTKYGAVCKTKNQAALNFPLVADDVKMEKEVRHETTINIIQAKQNTNPGSSKDSFMGVRTIKSFRCFRESNAKIDQRKVEKSLNNMKLLIKTIAKCDRFTVFGKHIAQKMSRIKKVEAEFKIAKAHIDNILQNLANGVHSSQNV